MGAAAWAVAPAARADDCDALIDLLGSDSLELQARRPLGTLLLLRDMAERCPDRPVMLAEMGYVRRMGARDSVTICESHRCDGDDDETRATAWALSLADLGLVGGGVLMAVLGVDESAATRSVPRLAVFWSGDTRLRLTIPFQ